MKEYSEIRRQQFLYEELYDSALDLLMKRDEATKAYIDQLPEREKFDLDYVSQWSAMLRNTLDRLSLAYTAGKPIEEVKALYPAVVDAFEAWCGASDAWYFHRHPEEEGQLLNSPIEFDVHTSYVQLLRLLSLGVLFNEGDLLRKIAKRITTQRNEDTIVEELLAPFVTDPDKQIEALEHIELYDHMTAAIWGKTKEASTQGMQKFLKSWYKFFEGAPWHNAHMDAGKHEDHPHWANYYGYWAWEAGALAYLYELDDRDYRENILYPKDLVAWARKQGQPPKTYTPSANEQTAPIFANPGAVCEKAGTWTTTALLDVRSIDMKVGETFPVQELDKSGNGVFWYWKSN